MEQKEFENRKDEIFEETKTEFARKAKYDFVMGIIYGLLCLAGIIVYYFFTEGESSDIFLLSGILLVISIKEFLFSTMYKNIMKAENAEELLSRYDAYTNKIGKWIPFIAVLCLCLIGYVIYNMITDINNERNGYTMFWLIVAFLVLWLMTDIRVKAIGWKKDVPIMRLRELVEKERLDTL